MNNSILEDIRKIIISDLLKVPTMKTSWAIWQPEFQKILGNNPSGIDVVNLGDHLSEIFKLTGKTGRGQSDLSKGGKAWEGLSTWYINLVCANTRLLAFPTMRLVPNYIKKAISVNHGTIVCNTESDITVVIFPEEFLQIETHSETKKGIENFFLALEVSDLRNVEAGIIQCKTNWNDNAQIPMLWNMIYSARTFVDSNISLGSSQFSMKDFGRFTYSFLTVPTTRSTLKSSSLAVLRVNTLSGGTFWGKTSESGVAFSVKEIFNKNFKSAFNEPITVTADKNLSLLNGKLAYFKLYGDT